MAEHTIYPYLSDESNLRCNTSLAAVTYDKTPPPQVWHTYSTWEDIQNGDADYRYDWLSLGMVNSFTSDYHIYGPHRMYFGFYIWGDRTTWGTMREPVHLWLSYKNDNSGDEREAAEYQMQLWYSDWGLAFDPHYDIDLRSLWDWTTVQPAIPASTPFAFLAKPRAAFESVAIRLINTQLIRMLGPTYLVALLSPEDEQPPMADAAGIYCGSHDVGSPPVCPFGYPDTAGYRLGARFIGTNDGYDKAYWPRIVVGGQGTERTVTPLVPGTPQSRGGRPGSGHRARL